MGFWYDPEIDSAKPISETGKHNELDYDERAGNYIDFAEEIFEDYCKLKGMKYRRLHLNDTPDFKSSPIPQWFNMNPLIKSFPDYFVYDDKQHLFCEIKSSYKIKLKDLKHYILFDSLMCEDYATNYCIVVCIRGEEPKFLTVDMILKALPQSKLDKFHDGPEYFNLKNL